MKNDRIGSFGSQGTLLVTTTAGQDAPPVNGGSLPSLCQKAEGNETGFPYSTLILCSYDLCYSIAMNPQQTEKVFTVSEITLDIRALLEENYGSL
ncbi:hypothetical protein ACFL4G_10930, partial [Thermodesulfobacteriota bacterium]